MEPRDGGVRVDAKVYGSNVPSILDEFPVPLACRCVRALTSS